MSRQRPVSASTSTCPPTPASEARTFGAMLRAVREARGFGRRQVANQCGVREAEVQAWEEDRTVPRGAQVARLVAMFPRLRSPRSYGRPPASTAATPAPDPTPSDLAIVAPQPASPREDPPMPQTPPAPPPDDLTVAIVRFHDQLDRLNTNLTRLADLEAETTAVLHKVSERLATPGPAAPPQVPAAPRPTKLPWTTKIAAYLRTPEAEKLAAARELTADRVAAAAGLDAAALTKGQRKTIGKEAYAAGFVPIVIGRNAPIYLPEAQANGLGVKA